MMVPRVWAHPLPEVFTPAGCYCLRLHYMLSDTFNPTAQRAWYWAGVIT